MNYFLSQKHRHLEPRKQVYKLVLEPEIKSTVISLQVLVAFLISLQRQKWQHPGAQSSSMEIATWSPWLLKLRLASWRHARVSCSSEQIRALVRCTGMSGWMHSWDSVAFLCTSCICSWWGEGDGIWGLEGQPCQVLQTTDTTVMGRGSRWQDNFPSRLKWLFLNGAIHDYNSSYICIVLKHTFLLWAQYWSFSSLKLWEVHRYHSSTVFVQCTLSGKDKLSYSSASLLRIEEVTNPDIHWGLVTFGLAVMDSWTEPGFLRAGWECSALWKVWPH